MKRTLESRPSKNEIIELCVGVSMVLFTSESARNYYNAFRETFRSLAGSHGRESGRFTLPENTFLNDSPRYYGHPIIISKEIAEDLGKRVKVLEENAHAKILSGAALDIIKKRSPKILDQATVNEKVFEQLQNDIKRGRKVAVAYDTIVGKENDENGDEKIKFEILEVQTAIPYEGRKRELNRAAAYIIPELRNYNWAIGNPEEGLKSLRELVPQDEEIFVLDVNPMQGVTQFDQMLMAMDLNNHLVKQGESKHPYPVSLLDITKDKNNKWKIAVRNTKGEIVRYTDMKNVLCRCTPDDIKNIEEKLKDTEEGRKHLQLLIEFFNDADNIRWIWHPSFQTIVLKEDLREFGAAIFNEGEVVSEGEYYRKPIDGNSGKNVVPFNIKKGETFEVLKGEMLHKKINTAILTASIKTTDNKTIEIPAVLEMRVMSNGAGPNTETGYRLFARFGPYYNLPETEKIKNIDITNIGTPKDGEEYSHTKTNLGFIMKAATYIRERMKKAGQDVDIDSEPWNTCCVFIEK